MEHSNINVSVRLKPMDLADDTEWLPLDNFVLHCLRTKENFAFGKPSSMVAAYRQGLRELSQHTNNI